MGKTDVANFWKGKKAPLLHAVEPGGRGRPRGCVFYRGGALSDHVANLCVFYGNQTARR
jgi:hypothetical protein